jgi:hypothetical protein
VDVFEAGREADALGEQMRIGSRRTLAGAIFAALLAGLVLAAPPGASPSGGSGRGRLAMIFFTTGARTPFEGELSSARADGTRVHLLRRGMPTGPAGSGAVLDAGHRRILCFCRGRQVDSIALDGSSLRRLPPAARDRYDVVDLSARRQLFWIRRDSRLLMQNADGAGRRLVARVSLSKGVSKIRSSPARTAGGSPSLRGGATVTAAAR